MNELMIWMLAGSAAVWMLSNFWFGAVVFVLAWFVDFQAAIAFGVVISFPGMCVLVAFAVESLGSRRHG